MEAPFHVISWFYFHCRQDIPLLKSTQFKNYQIAHFIRNGYKIYPGDDLILTCHYKTKKVHGPIFGGVISSEELCFALLTHYCPDEEFCPLSKLNSCMSWPTDKTLAAAFNFELDHYEYQPFRRR